MNIWFVMKLHLKRVVNASLLKLWNGLEVIISINANDNRMLIKTKITTTKMPPMYYVCMHDECSYICKT